MNTRTKSTSESSSSTPKTSTPSITLADINSSLMALTGKISGLSANQTSLNERVEKIDIQMFEQFAGLSSQVDRIVDTKLEKLRLDLHSEFTSRIDTHDEAIAALETDNSELRDTCRALSEKVDQLNVKSTEATAAYADLADRLDFAERECDIIVRGVPVAKDEDCHSHYKRIATAIGYVADTIPAATAFRLGRKKAGARYDPPILVRFPSRMSKSDFFKKYLGKLTLNLKDIGFELDSRIFLAESLTVARQKIFQEALKLKRDGKLFSVKSRAGVIMVQREENGRAAEIRRLSDL